MWTSGRLEPLQATIILISSPAVLGLPCPPRRGRRRVRSPSRSQPSQSTRPHPEPPGTTRSYAPRAAGAETSARLIDGTPQPPAKASPVPISRGQTEPRRGQCVELGREAVAGVGAGGECFWEFATCWPFCLHLGGALCRVPRPSLTRGMRGSPRLLLI